MTKLQASQKVCGDLTAELKDSQEGRVSLEREFTALQHAIGMLRDEIGHIEEVVGV